MEVINAIEREYLKTDIPRFVPGDRVKVSVLIREGQKDRIQIFEGDVIRIKGSGIKKTFTVRKISYGVGVERIFPFHSQLVKSISVVRKGKVRRAKLYYLRELRGKAAKIKEKRFRR